MVGGQGFEYCTCGLLDVMLRVPAVFCGVLGLVFWALPGASVFGVLVFWPEQLVRELGVLVFWCFRRLDQVCEPSDRWHPSA